MSTLTIGGVIDRFYTGGDKCDNFKDNMHSMKIPGKVVIITGANSGLEYETTLALAKQGAARIIMACRNKTAAGEARANITAHLKDIGISTETKIDIIHLDLASFASIKNFVEVFKRGFGEELHILINNAGVMALKKRQTTKDDLEMQMGINHFGHFLLTIKLLRLMRDTGRAGDPARIITVSSIAHTVGTIDRDDLQSEKYKPWKAYSQSKLANILFTRKLSKIIEEKGWPVTANSLNPGFVNTKLYKHLGWIVSKPLQIIMKSKQEGALTTIKLAIDPKMAQINGKYFNDCQCTPESSNTDFKNNGKSDEDWLWDESKQILVNKGYLLAGVPEIWN